MIDRHRSLIHTAVAGLVGLTLGLFIGWWVWPVQWIETPGRHRLRPRLLSR